MSPEALQAWLLTTRVSDFMRHSPFAWPLCACLHFLGLSLLMGTVGLFDLRLLGVGKGLSLAAMHRLIPWGVLGFLINAVTGTLFFVGQPYRYIHNPAFKVKLALLVVLGINIIIFYTDSYRKLADLGPDDAPPL